ncbi:MAG TPA: hypothetical protein VFQ15_08250 [Jiangellaceae bacterium]|nr:hypothetical protein [Jiangellaceae bacterium]
MRRALRIATVVSLAAVLAGCARTEPEVPVVPGAATSQPPTESPTPSPTSTVGVPELCEDVATFAQVAQILQVPLEGTTTRVYNDDYLSDSGRTGRLTCTYGSAVGTQTPAPNPPPTPLPPPVEISISAYTDDEIAAGRIDSTVAAAQATAGQAAAGQVQAQAVAGRDGFILADAEDVSFVLADGRQTYVITLRRAVVPPAAEPVVLLGLAEEVLGVPAGTPTASE